MTVKLVAARVMRYRGKMLSKGDPFDVEDAEEADLVSKKYATREVVAAPEARYKRRDMRAEERTDTAQVASRSNFVGPMTTKDAGTE